MAVYTQVSAETLEEFLAEYDVGTLRSAKGIAEGVENTNYFVETSQARFILTLYEKRVDVADLPYFLSLTAHLAEKGLPVPAPIEDRRGRALQDLCGRKACLIEFLSGVSVDEPGVRHAQAAGQMLAEMHLSAADFADRRPNDLSVAGWQALHHELEGELGGISPGLDRLVGDELRHLAACWPQHLLAGTVHADLFADNVLFSGDRISGVIDFYFACTDLLAYDLAVTHAAWAFDGDGAARPELGEALVAGYQAVRPLSEDELGALPDLCRGAALRFLLTRAYDWINTPPTALVTRKDPLAFARRLEHYRAA
ncbi:homoserine kinase [Pacificimonas flava]|uniref:Homoserine kinase n=2 Tax=Pacificimonas TaxID=1960290 RepID=A0A219B248_9SPHN|nr:MULTISPECIES: homoserine kinase [Pacificimonas]MBZ6377910.1 homoserine kinase [Pacificimonas aurantium]OWV32432.1 homoserine kinase [Pacificimonas flava]